MATKSFRVKSSVHVSSHQGSGCFSRFLILKFLLSSFQHFVFEFSVFHVRVLLSFSCSVNISSMATSFPGLFPFWYSEDTKREKPWERGCSHFSLGSFGCFHFRILSASLSNLGIRFLYSQIHSNLLFLSVLSLISCCFANQSSTVLCYVEGGGTE